MTTARARALEQAGLRQYESNDFQGALASFEQARALFAQADDQKGVGEMWNSMGVVYYRQGQLSEAQQALERAGALARQTGDRDGLAKSLGNLGSVYAKLKDVPQAEASFNQAIVIFRELGDTESANATLRAMSDLNIKQGQWFESALTKERELAMIASPNLWQRVQLWVIGLMRRLLKLA